ncbi:MAG: hypothetical protein GVY18_17010 [Bacteroidetes bacterium]|jgi:glycosidase|nr:hypothetical protein [Bacteroidota bacterium]
MERPSPVRLHDTRTARLLDWIRSIRASDASPFETARALARRLGAHVRDGCVEVGFWTPEIIEQDIPEDQVFLEVLTPPANLDPTASEQRVTFQRDRVPLQREGPYHWGAVEGLRTGRRDQVGAFYQLSYRDREGRWQTIKDPLAHSVPFGAFAPAEVYDLASVHADRADADYFQDLDTVTDPDGVPRITAPVNMLEIHPGTASADGTLAGLRAIYAEIARKRRAGEPLTPAEQHYVGYDAIQLMPIEPIIEHEAGSTFWDVTQDADDAVTVTLRRPDMTNWGYDVITLASPAVNPVYLRSGRPDELVDLIATLHTFPERPIKVVLDVVYGHGDNQSLRLMNRHFFAGANMYGQNLNYRHPVVRAILLEMQRRKSDFGVDGIRVDGAQDFKWWDAETDTLHHDDDYLHRMNEVEQDVCGQRYRPWMIFEDGRPWPREDWELASTYREVTKQMPNVVQWGPLTFAHNTPFLFTFWISKWWRIQEITEVGRHWITGTANHDTLRRGTQVDPEARINTLLGDTLPEILRNGYDNPAAQLFTYAFMPGVPMDFLNASMRSPWSFIRNTDERYGVKVAAEEARFMDWAVDADAYAADVAFPRLKAMGFTERDALHRFMHALDHAVQATDYQLDVMANVLHRLDPPLAGPELSASVLKAIARAWMDDVFDLCNVCHYTDRVDPERARFNHAVRQFRRARPWLRANFGDGDVLDRRQPADGTVLFYGLRTAPDASEQLLFLANMEGEPVSIVPTLMPLPALAEEGWTFALTPPGLSAEAPDAPVVLRNAQGVVLCRVP